MTEEKPPRALSLLIEGVLVAVLAIVSALALAGFVSIDAAYLSWWPWYLGNAGSAWFFGRVLLPEAWRYRREDKGGLAFVAVILLILLSNLCQMLLEDW